MSKIEKKTFPVLNMHCAGCATNVERTIKKLPLYRDWETSGTV